MSKSKKHYPPRIPLYATGIRAQLSRTGPGSSWWLREWTRRLEAMGLKGRLGRARQYATSGQVVSLEIRGPHVSAKVQGSRLEKYSVTLDFRTPEGAVRDRLLEALKSEPIYAARLLANDLPLDVRDIFASEGFDLFPGGKLAPGRYDVTTACSCPDYANPCKHVTAVLLLLGEEIASHPLTLLELRGILPSELCDED